MNPVIKASAALTLLVAVLSLVVALSGMHESSPTGAQLAFVIPAALLNIACVFWGLKLAAAGSSYVRQLINGLSIGVLAGVLIFLFSLLLLTVLLPDHLAEVKQATVAWIESAAVPDELKARQIESVRAWTPVTQSMSGLIGTLVTSVLAAAIIGIFLRKK